MNYQFQVNGVWKDGQRQFLYSEFACADLDEAHLNEYDGVPCMLPSSNGKTQPPAPMPNQVNEGQYNAYASYDGQSDSTTALSAPEQQSQPSPAPNGAVSGIQYKTMVRTTHAWYAVNTAADLNQNGKMETGWCLLLLLLVTFCNADISKDLNNDNLINVLLGAPNEVRFLGIQTTLMYLCSIQQSHSTASPQRQSQSSTIWMLHLLHMRSPLTNHHRPDNHNSKQQASR